MKVWIMMIMISVVLMGCESTTSEDTMAAGTEVATESGTEEATEPRWTKYIEYKVDEYLHRLPEMAYIITPSVLFEQIAEGKEMMILDLRDATAYQEGHLQGAVNTPWGLEFYQSLDHLALDQPVFVYCSTGHTSGQAHVMLRLLGFESYVINLGWDVGILGLNENANYMSTDQTLLGEKQSQLDEDILSELQTYLKDIEKLKGTDFEDNLIQPATLNEWISSGKEITLISVQSQEAYILEKIKGALHLAFDSHFAHDLHAFTMQPTVVVYDEEGQISSQALTALKFLGYDAYGLFGGLGTELNAPNGWVNKGFEVE